MWPTAYRHFLEQLAQLLTSGIPILEALTTLGESPHGRTGEVSNQLARRIQEGSTLGDAAREMPETFPPAHAALITAGERAGELPRVLIRLQSEVDRGMENQRALLKRMAYPLALLALFVLLVPIKLIFEGRQGTYLLIQVLFFGGAAGAVFLLFRFRRQLLGLLPEVPYLGILVRRAMVGETLSLLGLLIGSGIGIREALVIAADAARFRSLARGLRDADRTIEGGQNFAGALASIPEIPPAERGMIATGEHAGNLDRALESAGRSLEDSGHRRIRAFLIALAFAFYLLMALVIGALYISTMLGTLSSGI